MSIRVLIAEQHRLVRETIVRMLEAEHDVEVVAEIGRGDRAVDLAVALRADVAILDIDLPGLDGVQAGAELRRRGTSARALLLTAHIGANTVHRALAAGVTGFVHKGDSVQELLDAIRAVAGGQRYLSRSVCEVTDAPTSDETMTSSLLKLMDGGTIHELLQAIEEIAQPGTSHATVAREELVRELQRRQEKAAERLSPFATLTRCERDVLAGLVVGKSAETIAAEKFVSLATVRTQIRAVLQKLDVRSQVAAVALAWQIGWAAGVVGEERVPTSAAS